MESPIVQLIQGMLAPGLMISGCGLLLLGMNNKYSLVVNRIRLLNEEKRKIFHQESIDELRGEALGKHLGSQAAGIGRAGELIGAAVSGFSYRNSGGRISHCARAVKRLRLVLGFWPSMNRCAGPPGSASILAMICSCSRNCRAVSEATE